MKIIKKISIKDITGIFVFLILIIPAFVRKHILKKELWLICEHLTARDNGYVFFKYMRENHSEIPCYYAIDYNHNDYVKVQKLGNTIKWGSLKHYYYYMSATWNISSHKNGSPNHNLFTGLRLYLNLYNNFVFLQHGILYQNHEMFHKNKSKFKYFVCGAKQEYDFLKEKFGYSDEELIYTGLARFDNLHNKKCKKEIILYMPTYRRYLVEREKLKNSKYIKGIEKFINSKELEKILEDSDKYLYFCPHNGFKDNVDLFVTKNKRVKIMDISKQDVQQLLIDGSILITDFSSLHSDFAYMKKPIIYYQYDKKEFDEKHIGKFVKDTYFNYKEDGFGKVVNNEKDLLNELSNIINKKTIDKEYRKRIDNFFELNDEKNCERIYKRIVGE